MTDRRIIAIRQTLAAGVVLLAALFVVGHCSGCAMSLEERYRAKTLQCVDNATTKSESRACRAGVDREFHVDGGAP